MNIKVTSRLTSQEHEVEPSNQNCYEYYHDNTDLYGDYNAFQHLGVNHLRSEFLADIDALAVYFTELGLKRGDVYTIFMPTNIESLIVFFALNKIGVTVSFVHPMLPPLNLKSLSEFTHSKGIVVFDKLAAKYAEIIGASDVPCLVCNAKTYVAADKYSVTPDEEAMNTLKANIKVCDSYPDVLKKYQGRINDGVKQNGSDIAIFMSGGGTTGKSKTIKLSSYALNCLCYMLAGIGEPVREPGIETEIGIMPFFHAFGFCAGGLSAMQKGYKIVLMTSFDADKFVEQLKANKVVGFNGVPNMYRKLLVTPGFDGPHLASLRHLYSGGDDVPPTLLRAYEKLLGKNGSSAMIFPGYGLTECCAVCTCNTIWEHRDGTIGKPLQGNTIEIWDENHKKLPVGEIGEVVITGPAMMEGYLSEDGPVDDGIFYDENGEKWVLTGDLGKLDDDGYLYFVGRKKRVIIVSGYNVYPVDIEKLLATLPFIKESCPVQGYDDNNKPIVRVYAVLNENSPDEEECKKQMVDICAQNLSKFSVPRDIRFIDALPRTLVQKVDFMKLTQPKPETKAE